MDTPRYRIGNDLSVFWAIHNRDGSPYNLEGKEVRLFVTHPRGREEVVPILSTLPDGTINNVIRWDCKGEDQRVLGAYTLTVEILTAEDHKEIKKDICEAFVLVGSSCSECDDDKEINIQDGGVLILSSKLDVYQIGVPKVEIGANGNWFIDGVDTGVSALGGGEGLVNKIYKETDFGGEFDPESVIDTFNAHSINALWLKLKEFAVDSPAVDDVLIYNGSLWVNESFQSLINRYGGTGSGGGGETFWYLGSDGKVHINYDIQIHGNALIEGDAASGGSGEDTPAEGTVTSIMVDGYPYLPDASGVIDLSEAFKDIKVDLTDYYTITETENAIKNALSGYATIEALSPVKTWVDSLKDYITKDENGVHISTNLIIDGDVASGGEGEETPAEGTVTSIEVDGTPYIPNTLGVIDLTDAFKNVTAFLSDYYTKEEINSLGFLTSASLSGYAKETWVNEQIKNIDLSGYATIDELSKYVLLTAASQTITGEVIIDGNLIVKGDVASGGEGEDTPAEGTVTRIEVDGTSYDPDSLGVIDLSEAFKNVKVDLSDYYTKYEVNELIDEIKAGDIDLANYYTKEEIDGKGFLTSASLVGYAKTTDVADTYATKTALASFQSDLTAIATRVGTTEGNITSLTNGKADKSELSKYVLLEKASQTIKGDITIEGNLVITGDVASGGEGGNTSAEGTVTGVTVSGVDYTSVEAGLLDLTDLMALYALKSDSTKVSVSPSLSSGKSIGVISVDGVGTTLYAPATYAWSEITDKPTKLSQFTDDVVSGKYLPLSGGTISNSSYGALEIMRTSTTVGFSGIKFSNSGGVLGYIGMGGTGSDFPLQPIFSDGASSFGFIHSGNVGGYAMNVNKNLDIQTSVNETGYAYISDGWRTTGAAITIGASSDYRMAFQGDYGSSVGTRLQYNYCHGGEWKDWKTIAFTDSTVDKAKSVVDASGNALTLIHSGNYSSYALPLSGGTMNENATIHWGANNTEDYTAFQSGFRLLQYNTAARQYRGGIHVGTYYGWQMTRTNQVNVLQFRGYDRDNAQWSDWKYLAFTDSNVASATKLQTARTIWGQSFDGTGNVSGSLSLGNGAILGGASSVNMLHYDASNTLYLGYGMNGVGGSVICGNAIAMRYGASRAMGFLLNSSGNVTIGGSDLTTTIPACKFYVDGKIVGKNETNLFQSNSKIRLTHYVIDGVGRVYTYDENDGYCDTHIGRSDGRAIVAKGNGYVGIGTTGPAYKLDVAGTGRFTDSLLVSGTLTANSGATITGDVTINGNLIVSGDVASGGTGQDTPSDGSTSSSGVLTLTGEIPEGSNIPQSSLDAIGLTDQVIADLLIGKYHHVMYTSGVTTYCFVVSGTYSSAYKAFTLHWGDDYMDEFMGYSFSLGSSGGWYISFYEI